MITYKLIFELAQHLRKRGVALPSIRANLRSTQPCRVCDLCYELVVAEQKLIDVELQFARIQNIPIQEELRRVPDWQPRPHRELFQWRFLIYIIAVHGLEHCRPTHNLHLQYRFAGETSAFRLESSRVQLIRTHYFFSEGANIDAFLQSHALTFRVTAGPDWEELRGEGVSKTLANFSSRTQCQRHGSEVLVFYRDTRYSTVETYVGLVCDGAMATEMFPLRESEGLFFPAQDYFNCNPLPSEWMEVLVPPEEQVCQRLSDIGAGIETERTFSKQVLTTDRRF